jgi:diaminohydroxyphosphoribosylaminopyrimidine deaminase/5-amino-6-(5-phosphoribosylamino)uracil reductase
MTDPEYMQKALSLAKKAKGFTSPNPCVGAVVVKDGTVVGQGYHRRAGGPHAEVEALDDAGPKAAGATLYVTLEPCNHFGKTPPCTHKIMGSNIKKVVVGCKDPNPFVGGGGIRLLEENGIEVVSGVLNEEAKTLIEDFIWYVRNDKKPFVILKTASTLDGRTATATGDSKWITGSASRAFVHQIRHEADAILIGSGTLHSDNPSLTARIEGVETRDPARIILDTHLTIKENARVLTQTSKARTIMVTHAGAPVEKRVRLEKQGVQVLDVGLKDNRLDLQELMIKLGQMPFLSVLIEGGGTVAGEALRAGIVNKLLLFMAPRIMGGSDGKPMFEGRGPERIKDALELKKMSLTRFENDILVSGYLK